MINEEWPNRDNIPGCCLWLYVWCCTAYTRIALVNCNATGMTLPANDAFSLGLAHDQHRRSTSRARTPSLPRRSSSPKVSFSSPSPPSSTSNNAPVNGMPAKRGHKRKASARSGSQQLKQNGEATIEELVEDVDARIARERKLSHGDSPDKSKTVKKQIDWEIPRKTLHSSIGMYIFSPTYLV
jgi:diacylglycerol kinase (CTP)